MKKVFILFTCEHASNAIPPQYQSLFRGKKAVLDSHRGFDMGTKFLGEAFGKSLKAPVVYGKYSRLLVDLNRSFSHKSAFSEMTKVLSHDEKIEVVSLYHRPHWDKIRSLIEEKIKKGYIVLHIGVHSFTPALFGEVRNAEIGVLYDSRRKKEAAFALSWQVSLKEKSELRVRRNYPYLGKLDGLTTELRKLYSEKNYIGLEIEVNHAAIKDKKQLEKMKELLITSFKEAVSLHF